MIFVVVSYVIGDGLSDMSIESTTYIILCVNGCDARHAVRASLPFLFLELSIDQIICLVQSLECMDSLHGTTLGGAYSVSGDNICMGGGTSDTPWVSLTTDVTTS